MKKLNLLLALLCVWPAGDNSFAVIKPDFQVNPPDTAFIPQYKTDVAFQKNGSFVVVWEDRGLDHNNRQVYFQRYDSLGNTLGSVTKVSDTATGYFNQRPSIATDSAGNFAICYMSTEFVWVDPITGLDVFISNIYVRLYNSGGQPMTPSLKVDVDRPDTYENEIWYGEYEPHVARHKNGTFVVVWRRKPIIPMTLCIGRLSVSSMIRTDNDSVIIF